eukprot:4342984-Prymnesium_polylepis.1
MGLAEEHLAAAAVRAGRVAVWAVQAVRAARAAVRAARAARGPSSCRASLERSRRVCRRPGKRAARSRGPTTQFPLGRAAAALRSAR